MEILGSEKEFLVVLNIIEILLNWFVSIQIPVKIHQVGILELKNTFPEEHY